MTNLRSEAASRYMEWAKSQSSAPFNLATSGVADYPLSELPVKIEDLELAGAGPYGYGPLIERLAKKSGVAEQNVVYTIGTSMANYIAFCALVTPGDEVLIEHPTYDPLLAIAEHVGAKVRRFERRPDKGFRIGLGEIERRITPETRLVVLCNLHNPSSAFTDERTLHELGEMAAKVEARVLVDEVYLEAMFEHPWRSAFHLGPQFIATSSLTKAYGLSGLRCGWILAEPELVRRMWQIVDFTYGTPVHVAEQLAVIALDNLEHIRERARRLLESNRAVVNQFLATHPELECEPSRFGTTVFPRLRSGSIADFCKLMQEQFDTSVVPGEFFEQPQHFRLGFGGMPDTVRGGLERLGRALDHFKSREKLSTVTGYGSQGN